MKVEKYLAKIAKTFSQGIATEHSYRGDLKELIEQICPDVLATNEPKRVKCGAPDYVITRKEIPLGYIEAKDIIAGILDRKDTAEQIEQYFDGGQIKGYGQ